MANAAQLFNDRGTGVYVSVEFFSCNSLITTRIRGLRKVIFPICSHLRGQGGEGPPIWPRGGGYPHPSQKGRGVDLQTSQTGGYPYLAEGDPPACWDWMGVYPPIRTGWGYPPVRTGWGYPFARRQQQSEHLLRG